MGTEHNFRRLRLILESPPPWFWCASRSLWQRRSPAPLQRMPLELVQQLHWWLVGPLRWRHRRPKGLPKLPWLLALRACWLNSYRPAEVAWWSALGVRNWTELAQHTPDSLVPALHAMRRRHWPEQCRPALELLADKDALLRCAPDRWQAPFLTLSQRHCEPLQHGAGHPGIPSWWWDALVGEGVVLKPQRGHAGRAVIRFRWSGSELVQQALFRRLRDDAPRIAEGRPPNPHQLLAHWHRLCSSNEPALATPYLCHSTELPLTAPSVVVRVITSRSSPQTPVAVRVAWLEVPLHEGEVAFISPDGDSLPNPGEPLTADQKNSLNRWTKQLKNGAPSSVRACFAAAVRMHERLPPIDQVAWDWIPASPQPLLLEGNGCFGLLVPQLFDYRQSQAAEP